MSEEDYPEGAEPEEEISDQQKIEIAKWFLTNSPPGEIQYVAKDVRSVLADQHLYDLAASEAFPLYNKAHIISLELSNRSGDGLDYPRSRRHIMEGLDAVVAVLFPTAVHGMTIRYISITMPGWHFLSLRVLITTYGELTETEYIDPRTAQVATVDHVKQICTEVRPATDEELPSPYIEEFRCTLDAEIIRYVEETYPRGTCSVYSTNGKDVEGPGYDFELTVVISASRLSPQNFCNGSWRSIWKIDFKDDLQMIELRCTIQVGAHYFEEGNVQLDTTHECQDSTILQSPEDCAISIANIIRHHETEYLGSLEGSYLNLPDTTFKDLRRKLPVTRTLFPWHNTLQISLNRDLTKEIGSGK